MTTTISTRFPPLPPETLRAKAAHLTVGACFLLGAVVFLWSSWDELTCVAGENTSSGPCGIALPPAGGVLLVGVALAVTGVIVVSRGVRRPVDPEGSGGWRVGQGFVVIACGMVMGLMIPRYACPAGMTLTPVFRFCTSAEEVFPAPSPGLPWKFAALGIGIALGLVIMRWRSMPWWLASPLVVVAFAAAALLTAARTTGIPWTSGRSFTVGEAVVASQTAVQVQVSAVGRTSPNDSARWVGATIVPGAASSSASNVRRDVAAAM
jgi:hypothetical protein